MNRKFKTLKIIITSQHTKNSYGQNHDDKEKNHGNQEK